MTTRNLRREIASALRFHWQTLKATRDEGAFILGVLDLVEDLQHILRDYRCRQSIEEEVQRHEKTAVNV